MCIRDRYTYEDGVKVREEGPLPGAWSGRKLLSWSEPGSQRVVPELSDAERINPFLEEILGQLKIMNTHLQILTDEEIKDVSY